MQKLTHSPQGDTVTTPTLSMLNAITTTPFLGDDVLNEDTTSLESHMATLSGHEASLLVMSGTMGNQICLRSLLTQPPHSVLCDHRAHILEWEAGGTAVLCGALIRGTVPSNGVYLTLEDIQRNVVISDDVHHCPTRVISLENTLGGTVMPVSEIRKIAAFAHQHDIKMHLDGARIWEAVAATGVGLDEYCSNFDSVSMCFSKGLGAPIGSIVVGTKPFIKHARHIRKSLGGGTRQCGIISAAARVAVDEVFGAGPKGEGGKLQEIHSRAKTLAAKWEGLGGRCAKPVETNMVWLDLPAIGVEGTKFVELGRKHGLKVSSSGRLVLHHQISDEGIERLEKVMRETLGQGVDVATTLAKRSHDDTE